MERWTVSEYILNGTSAQLGYTVPFTLVHDRRQIKNTDNTETKHNPEKQTQNTATRGKSLVAFNDTWLGNEVSLFYNAPEPTQGRTDGQTSCHSNTALCIASHCKKLTEPKMLICSI